MSAPKTFSFEHLGRLSDHRGLFEHAAGTVRREEHGYCTDDNARLLVVSSREPDTGLAHRLGVSRPAVSVGVGGCGVASAKKPFWCGRVSFAKFQSSTPEGHSNGES